MEKEKKDSRAAAYIQFAVYAVLSAALTGFMFFYYRIRFTTTDDFLMAGILGGAWGSGLNQSVLFYSAYPLTWLLAKISALTGIFNVYGAYLMGLTVLIFTGLHWAGICSGISVFYHAAVLAAQLLVIGTCNWTTLAYLAFGTAVFLVSSFRRDMHAAERVITWILMLLLGAGGGFLRPGVMITTLVLVLPLLLASLARQKMVRQVIGMVLLIAILVTGRLTSGRALTERLGGTWQAYGTWNAACASFRDYTKPDPEKYADVYASIGWNENDMDLAFNWNYADQEVFGAEEYGILSGVQDFRERYNCDILDVIKQTWQDEQARIFGLAAAAVLLMALLVWIRKGDALALLASALFTLGLVAALYFRKRPYLRVSLPVILLGIFEMLLILTAAAADYDRASAGRWTIVRRHLGILAEIAAAGLLGLFFWYAVWGSVQDYAYDMRREDVRAYLTEHPDSLYCMTSGIASDLNVDIPVYGHSRDKYYDNKLSLGSWDLFSPRYYDQLEKFGVEDGDHLYREMVLKDNIYIISTKIDSVLALAAYAADHYGIESEPLLVDQIGDDAFVYSLVESGVSGEEETIEAEITEETEETEDQDI